MPKRLTKADAKRFKARWAIANARDVADLRKMSTEETLRLTGALMESAKMFRFPDRKREEARIRARWMRLRSAYRV